MVVLVVALLFNLLLALVVYEDARDKSQSPGLWAVLVFLFSLVGVILYLLTEKEDSGMSCKECGEKVDKETSFCPNCGSEFERVKCHNCGKKIEPRDDFCPGCGAETKGFDELNVMTEYDSENEEIYILLETCGSNDFLDIIVDGDVRHTFRSPETGDSVTLKKSEQETLEIKKRNYGR